MNNNFLYNHLVAVRDRNTDAQRGKAYRRAIEKDKTNRFFHNCIQNCVSLKDVMIELYYAITENTIEEFKQQYDIEHFDKLCLLTLAMFYVDYIKFNPNPISDRMASITDFMFDYVGKFEPLVWELQRVTENVTESKTENVTESKTENKKRVKVKVMSYPDLIMFESYKECNDYYNICNSNYYVKTGGRCDSCGQTFRKIKRG